MRIAIIGCGQIADVHIGEIQWIPGAEVVAVCDANEIMADQAAERFGVPAHFSDAKKMLEAVRPDVVHVTTPPQSHLALGKLALEHGAHVYVEKPFTINAGEAEELVACASRANREVCVGHNFLFDAAALEVREMVDKGRLGEIVHLESKVAYNLDGPFGKVLLSKPNHWVHHLPGKLFQNVISHAVYCVTDYLTDPMPDVHAMGYRLRRQRFGDERDAFNDELRIALKGSRCTADILFSCHARPLVHSMNLYGTKGRVHLDYHARSVSFERISSLPGALGRIALPFQNSTEQFRHGLKNLWRVVRSDLQYNDGMRRLFHAFYQAIQEGKPSPIPMNEAVRVTRILDEIFRQSQSEKAA